MSKELYAAMAKAFPEIEGATKDSNNPHFRSKYADLASVVEAIKPALCKNGLFFAQITHEQDGGVCVETQVFHSSGESMSFGKLFVPASKNDAQGYGSALTYARRYSLMAAFGVAPEDDDGNAAAKTAPAKVEKKQEAVFPIGPARNKTDLSSQIRAAWLELDECGDADQFVPLLAQYSQLFKQLEEADDLGIMRGWWYGGGDNPGLKARIEQRKVELEI